MCWHGDVRTWIADHLIFDILLSVFALLRQEQWTSENIAENAKGTLFEKK
jgi:hypothetical protein